MKRTHLSIKIRRLVEEKFGMKCAFPGCRKPAVDLHHVKRFAIVQRHMAEEIVPLCKIHHELAHVGAIKNEDGRVINWSLILKKEENTPSGMVDKTVRRHRDKTVKKTRDRLGSIP